MSHSDLWIQPAQLQSFKVWSVSLKSSKSLDESRSEHLTEAPPPSVLTNCCEVCSQPPSHPSSASSLPRRESRRMQAHPDSLKRTTPWISIPAPKKQVTHISRMTLITHMHRHLWINTSCRNCFKVKIRPQQTVQIHHPSLITHHSQNLGRKTWFKN